MESNPRGRECPVGTRGLSASEAHESCPEGKTATPSPATI